MYECWLLVLNVVSVSSHPLGCSAAGVRSRVTAFLLLMFFFQLFLVHFQWRQQVGKSSQVYLSVVSHGALDEEVDLSFLQLAARCQTTSIETILTQASCRKSQRTAVLRLLLCSQPLQLDLCRHSKANTRFSAMNLFWRLWKCWFVYRWWTVSQRVIWNLNVTPYMESFFKGSWLNDDNSWYNVYYLNWMPDQS